MSTQLSPQDREFLEQLALRKTKPTRRQKAQALLDSARGSSLQQIAQHTGIAVEELDRLFRLFDEQGLAGLGLVPPRFAAKRLRHGTIEATPGICGGSARISGTRIPVWVLVEARELGVSEAQLLLDYPALSALNLVDAWDYASRHREEITAEIHRNQVA